MVHRTSTDLPEPTMVVVVISLIAIRNGRPSKATNATTATTSSLRIPHGHYRIEHQRTAAMPDGTDSQ